MPQLCNGRGTGCGGTAGQAPRTAGAGGPCPSHPVLAPWDPAKPAAPGAICLFSFEKRGSRGKHRCCRRRRGEGPSAAMSLANSHAERHTRNSPSSGDVMTKFSPAHENLRVRRERMAPAGIAGGAQSCTGVWGWALRSPLPKNPSGQCPSPWPGRRASESPATPGGLLEGSQGDGSGAGGEGACPHLIH